MNRRQALATLATGGSFIAGPNLFSDTPENARAAYRKRWNGLEQIKWDGIRKGMRILLMDYEDGRITKIMDCGTARSNPDYSRLGAPVEFDHITEIECTA